MAHNYSDLRGFQIRSHHKFKGLLLRIHAKETSDLCTATIRTDLEFEAPSDLGSLTVFQSWFAKRRFCCVFVTITEDLESHSATDFKHLS